jgi:carboxyl-terminal processing protease
VIGETTFGKALVQSVYRLSRGAAALITTARYYTPSGRLIQRPWDGSFDEYLTYTLREQDPNKAHKPEDLKFTDAGRKVYSGGGVEPDKRFDGPMEGFNPTRFGRTIYNRQLPDSFAQRFTRKGDTRISPNTKNGGRELAPDFVVDDAMMEEFKEHVKKQHVKFDEASWEKDKEFLRAMVHFEIDLDLFGMAQARKNLAQSDPQLHSALGLFAEAEKLTQLTKQRLTKTGQ